MLRKIFGSPLVGAVGAVISWIWEGACLIGPPIGIGPADKKSYIAWGLLALLVCNVQAFAALLYRNQELNRRLQDIEKAKPAIKPKLPGSVHELPVFHGFQDQSGNRIFTGIVPFLRITFWNDPAMSLPQTMAKGVRAFVSFFPSTYSVSSMRMDGRWVETDQPSGYSPFVSKAHLLETTFGIGESKTVDIAYISGIDDRCYAWNNDNYQYPDFRDPNHILDALGCRVTVRLRGEYLDESFTFYFWIKNGHFVFTQPSQ